MTGPEVKDLRAALGLTRPRLAAFLGVTGRTLERWEQRGAPSGGTPVIVMLALRCAVRTHGPTLVAESVRSVGDVGWLLCELLRERFGRHEARLYLGAPR